MLKVIRIRNDLLGGLGVIHHQIGQKIRIHPRMLKVDIQMLALHMEGFMEINHVSLKERLAIIWEDRTLSLNLYICTTNLMAQLEKND